MIIEPVLPEDCALQIKDGEFSWKNEPQMSTKHRRRSQTSTTKSTQSDLCDSDVSESGSSETIDRKNTNRAGKTLSLTDINVHILKVNMCYA